MTITDYLIDTALIAVVLLQVRGRRLTVGSVLPPVVLVAVVARSYLHGIPTAGNDLVLVLGAVAIGMTLGALCGLFTSILPGSGCGLRTPARSRRIGRGERGGGSDPKR